MNLKVTLNLIRAMLEVPGYRLRLLVVWLVILFLFLWLPRINLLAYIFTQAPLNATDKASYIFKDFGQQVGSLTNPIVLSTFVFSLLAALSVVLLIFMVRTGKRLNTKSAINKKAYAGIATAAIGSHVLSCGGTLLLAPLLPALAGTGVVLGGPGVTINLWLATAANLAGSALVLVAIVRTSRHLSNMLLTSDVNISR